MPQTLSNTYEELVEKAQQLFWVNGYKSVTNQELADHLDVSSSTIYNKYSKEMLFLDSLEYYIVTCSDPVLQSIRQGDLGVESLRPFFYSLIDALLEKTFPKSCLIVNTVVELKNDVPEVTNLYERYFSTMIESYRIVLGRAVKLGEIKDPGKVEEYAQFLLGVIFSLGILYKIRSREELRGYVDDQLSLIV